MSSSTISPPEKSQSSVNYAASTVKRAERALCCSPFQLDLFIDMRSKSVLLPLIASQTGIEQGYVKKLLPETQVENHLMWLIKVGLLRREVDGQGITDSFRLTPLGRKIVARMERVGYVPASSWWDRIRNILSRLRAII